MKLPMSLAALAALALSACTGQDAESTPSSKAPAARIVGKAVSCLPLHSIRSSTVYDDHTIDFEATGGKLYRNTLPSRCPGLGFERAFSYKTSQSSLCSVDIIHVLERTGAGMRTGAGCGLGEFVPIELEKVK